MIWEHNSDDIQEKECVRGENLNRKLEIGSHCPHLSSYVLGDLEEKIQSLFILVRVFFPV